MMLLPLALFLAAFGVASNYTIDVPRGDWSYVDVFAREPNAVVNCEFDVVSEHAEVRIVWIARKDLDLFRSGQREPIIAASDFGSEGGMRQLAPSAGDYALVVENRPTLRTSAKVHMKVWVQPAAHPTLASSQRRLFVIFISTIIFIGMVSFSAYRLSAALDR